MHTALSARPTIRCGAQFNVTTVVRLNKKCYDRCGLRAQSLLDLARWRSGLFVSNGVHHYDFFFVDGSTPSPVLLNRFIEACEASPGP